MDEDRMTEVVEVMETCSLHFALVRVFDSKVVGISLDHSNQDNPAHAQNT